MNSPLDSLRSTTEATLRLPPSCPGQRKPAPPDAPVCSSLLCVSPDLRVLMALVKTIPWMVEV